MGYADRRSARDLLHEIAMGSSALVLEIYTAPPQAKSPARDNLRYSWSDIPVEIDLGMLEAPATAVAVPIAAFGIWRSLRLVMLAIAIGFVLTAGVLLWLRHH
jgi:hypothetical protein